MRWPVALAIVVAVAGCAFPSREPERPYYEEVIAGAPFTDLIVEIDHAPGRAPSVAAREHLVEELRNVTGKTRVGVKVEQTLKDDGAKRWSAEELLALEAQTRSTTHAAPVAVLHILYPAGEYQNDSVAGVTITGRGVPPVTIFLDTIAKLQSPVGPVGVPQAARDEVEKSTLLHESGHAMGLVNNGLPMVRNHEDAGHPGHSGDRNSVMYWQVETLAGIRQALLHDDSLPAYFDGDDRADLRAAGGR